MRERRFQLQQVIERGYLVAQIRDTKAGRDHFVYRKGDSYLEWDRQDAPVKNSLLRIEAREALTEAEDARAAV